jgi:hypothetical protein
MLTELHQAQVAQVE